jgi:hypothetical protein
VGRGHVGHNSALFAHWGVGVLAAMLSVILAIPVVAGADALPDGRVYEQVSPVQKNGSSAGVASDAPQYSWATADGDGLLYGTQGPMGTVHRGLQSYAVGRRTAGGWSSESALPAGSQERIFAATYAAHNIVPSDDLTKILFTALGSYVPDNPSTTGSSAGLYEGHADGTVDWLSRPVMANPVPAPGYIPSFTMFQPVGGAPDLKTVYFWSGPLLLEADAARAPNYDPSDDSHSAWGMYEYRDGVLEPAGTLPDGTQPAGGAAPASSGTTARASQNFTTPDTTSHQVSRDGSTLLFVSPDPGQITQVGATGSQLYLRRGGHSRLVSHTQQGDDVPAPSGVSPVQSLDQVNFEPYPHEFAYGSADGSTVIFQSVDVLAAGAPDDASPKAYRYDVATGAVSHLPGVTGTIVAASDDDRQFLFKDATRIALWDEGTITTIASGSSTFSGAQMSPARATASGSVFLFSTQAVIPGFNSGGVIQVYRYETAQQKLTCVSCPPDGITPSGNVTLSNQDNSLNTARYPGGELNASRGMSDDGNRVFFDTPDPLVSRDTNGQRDVYEWTPGGVSLISGGRSGQPSFIMDNSANGNDVFFATAEDLGPVDRDLTYDVYDARVGGGFKVDVTAPCTGDGCQGALSTAPATLASASTVFSGAGNEHPTRPDVATTAAKLKLGSRKVVGGTLEVTVTVTGPGRVGVTGNGLRNIAKSYARSGTFTLRAPLTAKAKRVLKAQHRLKLSVRVGFSPKSGTASSSVKFVLNAKA